MDPIHFFESVRQQSDGSFHCVRDGQTMFVPNDMENRDRQMIDEWVSAGGIIEPYVAPPPPPIVLSAELLFFDRMTPDEYDDLDASIASNERASIVRGWRNANSFTEGTDMWALLVKHLEEIGMTSDRRAELLARP